MSMAHCRYKKPSSRLAKRPKQKSPASSAILAEEVGLLSWDAALRRGKASRKTTSTAVLKRCAGGRPVSNYRYAATRGGAGGPSFVKPCRH